MRSWRSPLGDEDDDGRTNIRAGVHNFRKAENTKRAFDAERSTQALATTTQLSNRGLQQEKISAWLARVERDDRTTLCGERETFRLAIQIAEPPRIEERSGTASRLPAGDHRAAQSWRTLSLSR